MSREPMPHFDSSSFFVDSSDKFGCRHLSHCYRRPQQCNIPKPVFDNESPLFSYQGLEDSASGPAESDTSGPSRSELERLSTRPYSTRSSDAEDFAHVWERTILPIVLEILQANCDCDFSIDVHNFPELSSESVPRVIYITLPIAAPVELQELVREELAGKVPPRFHATHLKFRQGSVRRTNWWGTDDKHIDPVCEPRNRSFQPVPTIGMSIGPHCSADDAGSLGGFVKVGGRLYGLSCRHVFEKAIADGDTRVVHPANGDHQDNLLSDPRSQQSTMERLFLWSREGATRISQTFDGHDAATNNNRVEMDWCLFGPVPEGKNMLTVPCFDMNRMVAVERSATIEGNTEVYALARTSGYSLGFTSDVPGVQRMMGVLRREWTVRQYCPNRWDPSIYLDPPWQALKQWVTSGIGVQGDSGAWLMRRSDNAVIGLIWARNHDHGLPIERVRLTYITPIIDILADIRDRAQVEVALPVYSDAELHYDPPTSRRQTCLDVGHAVGPWNHLSMNDLGKRRREEEAVIRTGVVNCDVRVLSSSSTTLASQTGDESDPLGPYASTSVQVSVDTSNVAESVSPSCATATVHIRERFLLGIGAEARFQLGRSDLMTLPSLELDLGTNSSVSSVTFDELDQASSNDSVRVAVQGETGDDEQVEEVDDPIRSKATFRRGEGVPKLLLPASIMG